MDASHSAVVTADGGGGPGRDGGWRLGGGGNGLEGGIGVDSAAGGAPDGGLNGFAGHAFLRLAERYGPRRRE